ncbi:hypothetical protein M3C74_00455 [Micrococcus lylae]|uniref:hypothetical protein n=1 Tax=Micrococcus lylae TaxID=1273 RepID=UPI0021A4DC01|nr:hypothetical protein [Micrococcus lylae]MCT2006360.1 hypothetical protein [Micrococcus lylae]MCT2070313.1 hypothetical protein [Micrococcus lylae]
MIALSRPDSNAPLARRLEATARPVLIHLPGSADADSGVDARIEVSGSVLMTWAAKTAALCAAEDLDDGTRLRLDLPVHWMSLAVAFGAVCAGVQPAFTGIDGQAPEDVDAVVAEDAAAPVPAGALGLRLALPRDLSPVRAHPDEVSAADVDMAEALLGEADRFADTPRVPAAASLADPAAEAEDVLHVPGAAVLARGPLQARHLAAALQAWEEGRAVVVCAGDLAAAAREAGFSA